MSVAVFGAGCFWCVEAIFLHLNGVYKVVSGYTGGHTKNPTYKDICAGDTGHVEVCKITFNPKIIPFKTLLKTFWENHDPTTLNKQGADIGTQYRSAIFYTTDKQKELAINYKDRLENNNAFKSAIVTEIKQLEKFYIAEDYHQNYYNDNPNQPYCMFVIKPKLEKFFENNEKYTK